MISIDELLTMSGLGCRRSWFEALKANTCALGCDGLLFALKSDVNADNSQAALLSDYSQAWRAIYDANDYSRIDPVVSHCMSSTSPIVWNDSIFKTPLQLEFREESKGHGVVQGVSLPLHGMAGQVGVLSVRLDSIPQHQLKYHIARILPGLALIRDYAVDTFLSLADEREPNNIVQLSHRELEVLKWSAFGKTTWEIARILSCSEANINYHFAKVRKKFNVGSRRMAIVKALQTGLLEF
ncbi:MULTISPECIES: autoinducer binding domain-containing protein [Pseudomonas]|uniref:LuxR family transcriptional regulator, quorum-sensing transcription factor LasR n=4 Tax=Pseudomonas TaxID=286 RepID=A0AB37ZUX0_PSESX|nr:MULTISPECIES: autoinducer binding domain-containing protein [Pseudomonas]MCW6054630.1 LuxR family transcriptional regulator [Pseudomonas fragi]MBI6669838.1 LuxR family transcriptional regulator [Pseudomonas syringae]MBI6673723.1 LuxR family transcriptional regulator [Pseudomonas syringae]MBI6679838.1 LuxR family transcriptional regulator [Pseudomonas syringae]MBI6779564.1 LuxR family transcriptional regulator [Pseudomonas syringae]